MVGWHHQFNGPELGRTLGGDEGHGGLVCCSPWSWTRLDDSATTCKALYKNPLLFTISQEWKDIYKETFFKHQNQWQGLLWGSSGQYSMISMPKVKVVQSCLTLCDPMDYTVHGMLQARILEWVAVSSSRGSSQPRHQTQVSRIAGRFFTS